MFVCFIVAGEYFDVGFLLSDPVVFKKQNLPGKSSVASTTESDTTAVTQTTALKEGVEVAQFVPGGSFHVRLLITPFAINSLWRCLTGSLYDPAELVSLPPKVVGRVAIEVEDRNGTHHFQANQVEEPDQWRMRAELVKPLPNHLHGARFFTCTHSMEQPWWIPHAYQHSEPGNYQLLYTLLTQWRIGASTLGDSIVFKQKHFSVLREEEIDAIEQFKRNLFMANVTRALSDIHPSQRRLFTTIRKSESGPVSAATKKLEAEYQSLVNAHNKQVINVKEMAGT